MAMLSLDLTTDIQPVSDFRANAAGLIRRVRQTRRPVILTQHGRGAAVLVDIHDYQALLDEIEALRDIQQGLADVSAGRVVPHDEARAALVERYRG